MKNLNVFQFAILITFVILAAGGVIAFSTLQSGKSETSYSAEVVIWGMIPKDDMDILLGTLEQELGKEAFLVRYFEKSPLTFDQELIEALAAGRGPDVFILGQDKILKHGDKTYPIAYEAYPERTYLDTFAEEGDLYLMREGILAFPFSIDPMVMYWNRDILSSAGIANPPKYWNEFFELVERTTRRDRAENITQSGVAFGEVANITHAKDILTMLIEQLGNPIVNRTPNGFQSVLDESFGLATSPAESVIRFFIDFSNPVKPHYSWNRALPASREAFLAGDLAVYLGFASELYELREKNPNLNFDVAFMPQVRDSQTRRTSGSMQALAVSKHTRNLQDAFRTITILTGPRSIALFTEISGLPPVRRDLIAKKPVDAYKLVFYDSALVAKAWLDPDPEESLKIFQNLIETSVSGKVRINDAIKRASEELDLLLQRDQF